MSNERDKQTLDALLASPLRNSSILFAKWLGNILSVRWGWLWLGLMYALGLVSGGLHPLALGLLVVAWLIYAGTVSMLGLWFSVASRTTLRAALWTLIATADAGAGHWLLWIFFYPILSSIFPDAEAMQWLLKFQIGLTPPIASGCASRSALKTTSSRLETIRILPSSSVSPYWASFSGSLPPLLCGTPRAAVSLH